MRTIFIGDIHGCHLEFQELLDKAGYTQDTDRLFLTGDLFTRGPTPVEVWNLVRQTGAKTVLGNHDDKVLGWLRQMARGEDILFQTSHHQETFDRLQPLADVLLPWLEETPLWIKETDFLLVHAGINPELGFEGTTRHEFLAIRTWPPTGDIYGDRWHDYYTPHSLDARLVVFGHDAPAGLVVKRHEDGRPYVIGLDTGCVYGGRLSAYILEEDRIVQVESRQVGGLEKELE